MRRTLKVAFYSLYTVNVVVCMREIVAFLKLWGRCRLPFVFLTLFINYQWVLNTFAEIIYLYLYIC